MEDIAQVVRRLSHKAPHLVCGPKTDLVIEGYPRSGNTFTVDMLQVLMQGRRPQLRIAHHTHSADNLRMAAHHGVPCAVLVRAPQDAILSFMIYSGRDAAFCTERYLQFYRFVLALRTPWVLLPFELVVKDFNAVVDRLNPLVGGRIPRSADLAADAERARQRLVERTRKTGFDPLKAGLQTAEREARKAELRQVVTAHLAADPRPAALHAEVLARDAPTRAAGPDRQPRAGSG